MDLESNCHEFELLNCLWFQKPMLQLTGRGINSPIVLGLISDFLTYFYMCNCVILFFQVRTAIILISIFCVLFNIPRFFEFQPVEAEDIRCNYTVIQIGKSHTII